MDPNKMPEENTAAIMAEEEKVIDATDVVIKENTDVVIEEKVDNNTTVAEKIKPIDLDKVDEAKVEKVAVATPYGKVAAFVVANLTLKKACDQFLKDYKEGKLGVFKKNTFESTKKDMPRLQDFFGKDRVIGTITAEEAEAYIDAVSFGKTARGTDMTEGGAASLYYSARRVFDYYFGKADNVFRKIPPDAIPRPRRDKATKVPRFTNEECEKFVKILLNLEPEFTNVKVALFTLLAFKYQLPPGNLFVLTWDDIAELKDEGLFSPFFEKLLDNYKVALEEWLDNNDIKNFDEFVFVKTTSATGEAEAADSGFFGTWLKKNIQAPNDLPLVTVNTLSGKKTPRGPLELLEDEGWSILGKVWIEEKSGFGGSAFSKAEMKAILDKRAARRAAYQNQ